MQIDIHASWDRAQPSRVERAVAQSALGIIAGVVLSGPLALALIAATHPQPAWTGPHAFAASFHPIQLVPYIGGFLLIGSCVALVASLHQLVPEARRARANVALALTAAFAALILFNYVVQTTFVPGLVRAHDPEYDPLISGLSMANPRSLAWALEMWGYGVYGVATWLVACAFGASRFERVTAAMYVANGVMSIGGAVATMIWPAWAMTTAGIASFMAWNALMVVMAALTVAAMRRRSGR